MNITKHVKLLKHDVKIACQIYENKILKPQPREYDKTHPWNHEKLSKNYKFENQIITNNVNETYPIFLLRGFGMTKEDSHGLASLLCEKYGHQVITVDNRGTGESGKPPEACNEGEEEEDDDGGGENINFSMKDMALDCIYLAEALNVPKFNLFGASMGGYISQHVALIKPSCINKLILACTHYGGPKCHPPTKRYEKLVSAPVPSYEVEIEEWNKYHKRLFSINFHNKFLKTEKFNTLLENFKHVQRTQILYGKKAQRKAIKEFIEIGVECELMDRFEGDNDFGMNTLIISGDSDNVVPVENSFMLRKCFPGSCMTIVEHAGHMFWEERTEDVAEEIHDFIFKENIEFEPGEKDPRHDSYWY